MGMPVGLGSVLAAGLSDGYRYFAGWTDKISGEVYHERGGDGIVSPGDGRAAWRLR